MSSPPVAAVAPARPDDGERIRLHITDHFNVRPDGVENSFTLCKDATG